MENPKPKKTIQEFVPFDYPISSKKRLKRTFDKKERDFLDVLLTRRSSTEFGSISLDTISELLFLSNNIQQIGIDESGYLISKRTVPSAGGRHPVDILISLPSEDKRLLHYYNPIEHSLGELSLSQENLKYFFEDVNMNLPIDKGCLIWFVIQRNKTETKYTNPESLYWRDTGALLYCLQLVANYLNLKSCPLGGLAVSSFDKLFDVKNLLSGGGLLIGGYTGQ